MSLPPADFIRANAIVAAPSLLPELAIYLATEITPIWQASEDLLADGHVPPPYWAFAWAGGQALARHLLDNPSLVAGKRVLDFGAGSGIVAIAAAHAGAAIVTAVEIDPFAVAAIGLNAALNRAEIVVELADVIGRSGAAWDIVLVGDMCYEQPLSTRLTTWLRGLVGEGVTVLLGDPGRSYVPVSGLVELARYTVPTSRELEDRETREGVVWRVLGGGMSIVDLGTVAALTRYPVKSMAGESLAAGTLRWAGIDGDRQYAFVRTAANWRFPWLTGRDHAAMVTWRARYADPADPRRSPLTVETGDGFAGPVGDPALLARLAAATGEEVRLLQLGRGTHDSTPVSVIATATGDLLAEHIGKAIDLRRFRANVVIATPPGEAWRETRWCGGTLVFGEGQDAARLHANVALDRCVMVTLDPDTATREPPVLRCVFEDFANEIGIRCSTANPGRIAVGDRVRLVTGPAG